MHRINLTTVVLIALSPQSAHAADNWPVGGPGTQMDNAYHSSTDVSPYVVFAQSTWPQLWAERDDPHEEFWSDVIVGNDTYALRRNFYASSAADPGQVSFPMAKLFAGPNNQCVVSFRPSLAGGADEGAAAWGALAVDVGYPIWGVIRGFWPADIYDVATDTYYHQIIQEIGGAIDNAAHSEGCSGLTSTGYSMGAALAQIYAYRSWVSYGSFTVGAVYAFNPGPAGNGLFRIAYNQRRKNNGYTSRVFCREGDPVKNMSAWAYFDVITPNWEMGCTSVGVSVGDVYNRDGPPVDHDLRGWRTCGQRVDAEEQCPAGNVGSGTISEWSSNNSARGTEGAYLGNFVWTTQGTQPAGYQCVRVQGDSSHNFGDNYFCSWEAIGLEWSNQGSVANKDCYHITESSDSGWGSNNYLCVQQGSGYRFRWSSSVPNPSSGERCAQWMETNVHSWQDNYLCWTTDNTTNPGSSAR